eukprot:TRINITY_DN24096_c0_g1_i3.p2 TRINITY_DN24096_c0_g1~~TRINITY_DN24096_c0_g1_i3.p2  ORF type:complete len:162 (+),score=29.08 TRINITY_DN24096_c0_g1_i3:272-757(+)
MDKFPLSTSEATLIRKLSESMGTFARCFATSQPLSLGPDPNKSALADKSASVVCNRLSCMYELCHKRFIASSSDRREKKCGAVLDLWAACYAAELRRVGLDSTQCDSEIARAKKAQVARARGVVEGSIDREKNKHQGHINYLSGSLAAQRPGFRVHLDNSD